MKLFQKTYIHLKNLNPQERIVWNLIDNPNRFRSMSSPEISQVKEFLWHINYKSCSQDDIFSILKFIFERKFYRKDFLLVQNVVIKCIQQLYTKNQLFTDYSDTQKQLFNTQLLLCCLYNSGLVQEDILEIYEQNLSKFNKDIQDYFKMNVENTMNAVTSFWFLNQIDRRKNFVYTMLDCLIETNSQNFESILRICKLVVQMELHNDDYFKQKLYTLIETAFKNQPKLIIYRRSFINLILRIYFTLYPNEINKQYDLPFTLQPQNTTDDFFEPLKKHFQKYLHNCIAYELVYAMNPLENCQFIIDENQEYIQIGDRFQARGSETEIRIKNNLFKEIQKHPGSELFNNFYLAGFELDHIVKGRSGALTLIELHGFQHYLSYLEIDKRTNTLQKRTSSDFNGYNNSRNNFLKNLGFTNFHTINWQFFFGKYGMVRENEDLDFLLDKINFDQFIQQ